MAVLQSGASADLQTIDPVSKAGRVSIYDALGQVIAVIDRGAIVPGAQGGILNSAVEGKVARLTRLGSDGALKVGISDLMLYDSIEGAAYDSNKWVQTATTMTVTQAIATGTLFNASGITTTATGIQHVSNRTFPHVPRVPLIFRSRQRHTAHGANNLIELGFGAPATAITASIGNGAVWRKDGTGQYVPVISIAGSEILGTPISNVTFVAAIATTDYAWFEVIVFDDRVQFSIYTMAGVLVNEQILYLAGTGVADFTTSHLQALIRTYNASAAGAVVQVFVDGTSVALIDPANIRDSREAQVGMGYSSIVSPTAYTQTAQHANSADPAAAVLANGTASYATLGGLWIGPTPTPAGAVTDFPLFAFTVPVGYTFYFTGVKLNCINRGIAVATTATVLEWFMAFNASSGSLASAAPYTPMRVDIGRQVFAIGAGVESQPTPTDVEWKPNTPVAVFSGRTVIVGLRIPVGTATATGFLRGSVAIDGWFE